jgi:hypothetical protein
MGSNARRRAEKKQRRGQASGGPPVRQLIWLAVRAAREGDRGGYRELVGVLAAGPPHVPTEVAAVVAEVGAGRRATNWTGPDLVRQAERRLGPAHGRLLQDLLAGGPVPEVGPAIDVLGMLTALPPLPTLGPTRGRAGAPRPGHDPRMLEKVRALLAKAESTTFPEEAEALSAKAQALMARHAIDEAMVGLAGGANHGPCAVRLPVDDPYARAKSVLLSVVAGANGSRAVWSEGLGFSTVFGFESDLEFVEILYTSLLVQATAAMVAAGSQVDRAGRSRTRSFRQSFLLAYATRIGHRLRAAEDAGRSDAAADYGDAFLPVLADRRSAVDAARDAAFPGAVSRTVSVTNAAGWAAGSAAADLASLSGRGEVRAAG